MYEQFILEMLDRVMYDTFHYHLVMKSLKVNDTKNNIINFECEIIDLNETDGNYCCKIGVFMFFTSGKMVNIDLR